MTEITRNQTFLGSQSSSEDKTAKKQTIDAFDSENLSKNVLDNHIKSFDDVLPYVGDFGRYQWLLLLALAPYSATYAFLYFGQIFLTLVPTEHWCHVQEFANLTTEQRISLAIPSTSEYPFYDTCHQWNLTQWNGSINSATEQISCTRWEYNDTNIPYASIAAELDWVCDRSYLVTLSQSIFFSGSIFGGFIFGWIADRKGRIPSLVLCMGIGLISCIAVAHTTSFWTFSLARFFSGLAFDTCINLPLITVIEFTGVTKRTLVVSVTFGIFFATSGSLLPWIAYYVANWRNLAYIMAVPMLSAIATPWILPESARWQLSNGMTEKVILKLKRIASINKMHPSSDVYKSLTSTLSMNNTAESATLLDIFKRPRLARNFVLLAVSYVCMTMVFDGHIYSLQTLYGSIFVSFSLTSLTDLPAGLVLAIILDRWGRRPCCCGTMALTAICSFALVFVTNGVLSLVFAIVARFCLNMTASILIQYTSELLPTPVRAQGYSFVHMLGNVTHTVAPYVVELAAVWTGLPMVLLGILACLTILLVMFLPETMGKGMPQTLEDGEQFWEEQQFWTIPCCTKSSNA